MQKAKTDITYCVNKECQKCWRHENNYEFEKNKCYSFQEGCEERNDKNE